MQEFQPPSNPNYSGGRLFRWQNGQCVPIENAPMDKQQAQGVYHAVAGLRYQGVWNPETQRFEVEPEYEGLTVQEVITLKHAQNALKGDQRSIDSWQDRMMGKPKQSVDSMAISMSFTEYLDYLAHEEEQTDIVDVVATASPHTTRIQEDSDMPEIVVTKEQPQTNSLQSVLDALLDEV